jgi:NAD(P)-dependent dehydrogenase (short-subunit alcohol dehydrogenase family)
LAQRGATVHVTSRTEKIFKMTKKSAMASSFATAEFPLYRGIIGVPADVMDRITHHVVDSRKAADVATFWTASGIDFSQLAAVVLNAQAFCASGHPAQYVSLEDDVANRPDRFSPSAVYDNVTGQIVAPIPCSYEYAEGVGNEMHMLHATPHLIASSAPSKAVVMTATTTALGNSQDQYAQVKRKKVTVVAELAKRRLAPHGIPVHIVSPGAVLTDYTFAAAGVHDWAQAVVTDDGDYTPPLPSPLLQIINADTPFNIPAYEYQYLSKGFYMLSVVGSQVFNQGIYPLEFSSPLLLSHIYMQALQTDSPTHFVQRNQVLASTIVPDSRLLVPSDLTPTFVERSLYGDFNATTAFQDSIHGIVTRAEWDALNHYSHRDVLKQAVLTYLTTSFNVADPLTSSMVVAGDTAWRVI